MSSGLKVAYYSGTNVYYITQLVTSVDWSGDITEAARKCDISLLNTVNGSTKAINIQVGKEIRLIFDDAEIFRGIVFAIDITSKGEFKASARDYNHYLTKNTDSIKFVSRTASQIIKTICGKYGIAFGQIDDTKYVIPKLVLRDKTIYDMIIIALTETRKKTGKVYTLGNEAGKLVLRERTSQVKRIAIKDGNNLLSSSYSENIEDLRNSVRATGKSGEDAVGVTVSDTASIKSYGLMRHKENNSDKTDKELGPLARQLLTELNKVKKESNVDAIGHAGIYAGKMVEVSEAMTGISGGFYVVTDSHSFGANGAHTMSLKISRTLELNEISYEPPSESTSSSDSKATDTESSGPDAGIPKDTGGKFSRPASGVVTSGFGMRGGQFHYGMDIAQNGKVPIVAAADGKVVRSNYTKSYGECIVLNHYINGEAYSTVYAHMRSGSRKYKVGQTVKRGAILGYMGRTGDATGQHLHFEVHTGEWITQTKNAVNPASYV